VKPSIVHVRTEPVDALEEWVDLVLPRERVFFEGPMVCPFCRGRGVVEGPHHVVEGVDGGPYHVVTVFPDGSHRDGWPCRSCGGRGYREGRVIRERIPELSPEQEREAIESLFDLLKSDEGQRIMSMIRGR